MNRLTFGESAATVRSHPNRMDVACFIGFVPRRMVGRGSAYRATQVPLAIEHWLFEYGWLTPPYVRPLEGLLDLPVLIDNWSSFDRLFAWDERLRDASDAYPSGITYLGAAVQSFFEQGGQRCYIIRMGDALPFNASIEARRALLSILVPGYPALVDATALDQATWSGVAHVYGLPDVTFLSVPDLPDLVAAESEELDPEYAIEIAEQFVECSENPTDLTLDAIADAQAAPRTDAEGYDSWLQAVRLIAQLLQQQRRDVQLVASLPLPTQDLEATVLNDLMNDWLDAPLQQPGKLGTTFLQLAYPWIMTRTSISLPEELEPPEGAIVGVLARTASTRGAFHSAYGEQVTQVRGVMPELSQEAILRERGIRRIAALQDRVTLITPQSRGQFILQSDVTTSDTLTYRAANINRLMISLIRAARRIGETVVFEPSNPDLWALLENQMRSLLVLLEQEGALFASAESPAFSVRCDRSTMTQSDIDAGRVIVEVIVQAAQPIQSIRVQLSVQAGGDVTVLQGDLFGRDSR